MSFRISIHAAREGGDVATIRASMAARVISIHAAREGGDAACYTADNVQLVISIHAAREGGDQKRDRTHAV